MVKSRRGSIAVNTLGLIGRSRALFDKDVAEREMELRAEINKSSFLVIGAAGSIGQAVSKEIFKREPRVLHAVDISENNLVELVRELRSTTGYIKGDFKTFALDCGSDIFEKFFDVNGGYDYVLNLSALKHVRSEKDPFTLMRMLDVNLFNSVKVARLANTYNAKKYFCVSTDKAANPVNMMGASKRIMELFLARESKNINISMARFANVAFSDGSLLHGFNQRFTKRQPFSAPTDILRYFVTPQESGELCLLSCIYGNNLDIFFPKLSEKLHLIDFATIAKNYLRDLGYEPYECSSEDEARDKASELIADKRWPCYFFETDTTGEKGYEQFYTDKETLEFNLFDGIGIIKNESYFAEALLIQFEEEIAALRAKGQYEKKLLLKAFEILIDDFGHIETGKYLDSRM